MTTFADLLRAARLRPEFPGTDGTETVIFRDAREALLAEADLSRGLCVRRYVATETGWCACPCGYVYDIAARHLTAVTQHLQRLSLSRG